MAGTTSIYMTEDQRRKAHELGLNVSEIARNAVQEAIDERMGIVRCPSCKRPYEKQDYVGPQFVEP
jgi:hypothetical protein